MIDLFEFDGPSPEDWKNYCEGKLRKHPPWKRWFLRSSVRIASRVLDCNECYIDILPGDPYMEEVYACNGKIEVKRHHWPECPREPWDEDESWKDESDDAPQTVSYHAPLRQAA